MFLLPTNLKVLFNRSPVDMRKAINGLTVIIADSLGFDPLSDYLFVFRNKHGDKIKILYWQKNGFCLWYKRLEKEQFKFPDVCDDCIEMTTQQLNWLLDGLDFIKLKGHAALNYSRYF